MVYTDYIPRRGSRCGGSVDPEHIAGARDQASIASFKLLVFSDNSLEISEPVPPKRL